MRSFFAIFCHNVSLLSTRKTAQQGEMEQTGERLPPHSTDSENLLGGKHPFPWLVEERGPGTCPFSLEYGTSLLILLSVSYSCPFIHFYPVKRGREMSVPLFIFGQTLPLASHPSSTPCPGTVFPCTFPQFS